MADLWYYTSEGKPMDPVPTAELQRLARAGFLKPHDLVWKEGMLDWSPANRTRGLFDGEPGAVVSPVGTVLPLAPETRRERASSGDRPRSGDRSRSAEPYGPRERDDDRRPRRYPVRKQGLSTGAVVGIVAGAAVLLLAVIVGAVLLLDNSRVNRKQVVKAVAVRDKVGFQPQPNPPNWAPPKAWPNPQPIDVGKDRPLNPAIRPNNPPALGSPRDVRPGGLVINDVLTQADPTDVTRLAPCKVYPVRMIAGRTYTIDMMSDQFDSFLRVENAQFMQLALDDDSGGNLNARIFFVPPRSDVYRVIATSFDGLGGQFTLRIQANK